MTTQGIAPAENDKPIGPLPPVDVTVPLPTDLTKLQNQVGSIQQRMEFLHTELPRLNALKTAPALSAKDAAKSFFHSYGQIAALNSAAGGGAYTEKGRKAIDEILKEAPPEATDVDPHNQQINVQLAQLQNELDQLSRRQELAEQRINVDPAIRSAVNIGLVTDIESLYRFLPGIADYPENREFIRTVFEDQIAKNQREVAKQEIDILQALNTHRYSPRDFIGSDFGRSVTYATEGSLSLPEGVTNQNLIDALNQYDTSTPESKEMIEEAENSLIALNKHTEERHALYEAYRSGLNSGPLDEVVERLAKFTPPGGIGVGVYTAAEWWNQNYATPFAGMGKTGLRSLLETVTPRGADNNPVYRFFGVSRDTWESYEQEFQIARSDGSSRWRAWGVAHRNQDANTWGKFIMEMGFDPITYVGWYGKILAPIPLIARPIALAERGFNAAVEAPFRMLFESAHSVAPKTATQLARTYAGQALNPVKAFLDNSTASLTPMMQQSMTTIRSAMLDAYDYARRLPLDVSRPTRAVRVLTERPHLTREEARGIIRRLGGSVTEIDAQTAHIDRIFKTSKMVPNAEGVYTADESVRLLLGEVRPDVTVNDDLLSRAANELESYAKDTLAQFENLLSAKTSTEFVQRVSSHAYNVRLADGLNPVSAYKNSISIIWSNTVGGTPRRLMQQFATQTWSLLDKVSNGVARAHLISPVYGIGNTIDMYQKLAVHGFNPWSRGNARAMLQSVSRGLVIPPHLSVGTEAIDPILGTLLKTDAVTSKRFASNSAFRRTWQSIRDIWGGNKPVWSKGYNTLNEATVGISNRATANLDARLYIGFLLKELSENSQSAPIYKRVAKIINTHKTDLSGFKGDQVDELMSEALHRVTSDVNSFRNMPVDTKPEIFHARVVREILAKRPELGNIITEDIVDMAHTGKLWDDLASGRLAEKVQAAIYQETFSSPSGTRIAIENLQKEIMSLTPRNEDELRVYLRIMGDIREQVDNEINQQVSALQRHNSQLVGRELREYVWNDQWVNRIDPLLATDRRAAQEMIDKFRADLSSLGVPPDRVVTYEALFDAHMRNVEAIAETRRKVERVTKQLFAERRALVDRGIKTGDPEMDAFWDKFYAERDGIWTKFRNTTDIETRSEIDEAGAKLDVIQLPNLSAVDSRTSPVTWEKIGNLFGVSPNDVRRGMFNPELLSIRSRDSFIRAVRNQADRVAKQQGLKARDIGFTDTAIGSLYDEHFARMGISADLDNLTAPRFAEWDAARAELETYAAVRHAEVPRDAEGFLTQFKDNVLRDIAADPDASKVLSAEAMLPRETLFAQHAAGTRAAEDFIKANLLLDQDMVDQAAGLLDNLPRESRLRALDSAINDANTRRITLINQVSDIGDLTPELAAPIRELDDHIDRIQEMFQKTVDMPEFQLPPNAGWEDIRQHIADNATARYYLNMPRYDQPTILNRAMRTVFPFWAWETHRFFWLPQVFLQRPGIYNALGGYQERSDQGYAFNIPGTNIAVSPFRNGIFLNALNRLRNRDFPEFYDQFPEASSALDDLSKFGFYPSPWVSLFMSSPFSNKAGRTQIGEMLPAVATTPLHLLSMAAPDNPIVDRLGEILLSDRFRDRLTVMSGVLAGEDSERLMDINNKRLLSLPLSEEEQAVWQRSTKAAAKYMLLQENFAYFTLRPEERHEVTRLFDGLAKQYFPVTQEMLDEIKKRGLRFEDVVGPIPIEMKQLMDNNEIFKRWRGLNTGLLPSAFGEMQALRGRYFKEISDRTETRIASENILDDDFRTKRITARDWRAQRGEIYGDFFSWADNRKTEEPYSQVKDADGNLVSGMPLDFDELSGWSERTGAPPPILSSDEEFLGYYYRFKPEDFQRLDSDTGTYEIDWSAFYRWQDIVISQIPERDRATFEATIRKNETALERQYRLDQTNYMQAYQSLRSVALDKLTPEHRRVVDIFYNKPMTTEERAAMREITDEQGNAYVAVFEKGLNQAKQAFRYLNPDVDARLAFWGYTTTVLTDEARAAERRLYVEYRVASP